MDLFENNSLIMSNLPSPAKSWIRPRKLLKISGDQNGEVEYFIAKAQITVNTGVIDDSISNDLDFEVKRSIHDKKGRFLI